jgi:HTH-type transcriptional regulator, competence development regulator
MSDIRTQFGEEVRRLREAKKRSDPNFSLRKFAARAGISPTFLSKIENCEFNPPAPDKIKRMAALLDVKAEKLLALADKVDPDMTDMIKNRKAVADFLRTAQGVADKKIREITKKLKDSEK